MKTQQILSLETFITRMKPYIEASLTRSVKFNSTHLSFSLNNRDDLRQEAMVALTEVYTTYSATLSESELCRCGTRAITNHLRDLYERENSVGRGGAAPEQVRRKRTASGHHDTIDTVPIIESDTIDDEVEVVGDQLDRVLIREAMDNLLASATQVERRTLRAAMRPGALDTTEARALFRTLRSKVRRQVRIALAR